MLNEKSIKKSEIIPIPNGKFITKADSIGFVFPVYCHKVPNIVKQFILQVEFTSTSQPHISSIFSIDQHQNRFSNKVPFFYFQFPLTKNKHWRFRKMAALPRVDRFCYFRTLLARREVRASRDHAKLLGR